MLLFEEAVTPEQKDEVFRIRYRVYCSEKRWLDEADYPDGREKDVFDAHSVHFLARTEEGRAVGTVRLIMPSQQGFPIERNFDLQDIPPHSATEASRLAVLAEQRGSKAAMGLYRTAYNYAAEHGITCIYAVLEKKLLHTLQRIGYPFEELAEPKLYFGGYTLPARLSVTKPKEIPLAFSLQSGIGG